MDDKKPDCCTMCDEAAIYCYQDKDIKMPSECWPCAECEPCAYCEREYE